MISRVVARAPSACGPSAWWIGLFALPVLCVAVSCAASEYGSTGRDEAGPDRFDIVYRGLSIQPKAPKGLRIWGSIYRDHSKIEPEYAFPMSSEMFGFLGGLEFKRKSGSVFGLYYHYASEETKWESGLLDFAEFVNGDAKHHLIGLTYHKSLPLSHILLNLNGGLDRYGLRFEPDEALGGQELKPQGYQANFYPQFGVDLPLGKMIGFKPYIALHYHYLRHDGGFSETVPSIGLEKADYHGLNNLLGLRLNFMLGGGSLTLQGRAGWVHEYFDKTPTSLSYFGSIPGQFTPIRCNFDGETARDWAWLGIGAKFGYGIFRLFTDYDLMVNARQTSHTVSCCLCIGW